MNWFKNLKISAKILTGFSFSIIILVLVSGYALYKFNELNNLVKEINSVWLPSVRYIGGLNVITSDIRLKETQYILSGNREKMKEYKNTVGKFKIKKYV